MLKMQNNKLWQWGPVLLCFFICLAVGMTGVLDRYRLWPDMCDEDITFTDKAERKLSEGDTYGIMTEGPRYNLPAGTYRLKWIIDCDGVNTIHLRSNNNAHFSPDHFDVLPGRENSDLWFTVKEAVDDFQIEVEFCSGESIHIWDFRMYSQKYHDHFITLLIVCAAFSVLWLRACRGKRLQAGTLLIALAVVYASVPSFRDNFSILYDTSFHVARLWNLAEGLRIGQIPVRLGGWSYNGYGAITSVFYPDLFLYPFAPLLLMGITTNYVMQLMMISLNIASAVSSYCCAKRIFRDGWTAVLASVLYVLSIYRLTDSYVRCALGEGIAMAVLPVFFMGLWDVFFGEKRRWPVLALGAAGLFLSHLLTTFMCLLAVCVLAVLYCVRLIRERRLLPLLLAGGLALGMCLFQIVPLLHYSMQGIGAQDIHGYVAHNALSPAQLFLWGEGDMPVDPFDSTLSGQPIEPGMILIIGAALAVYIYLTKRHEEGDKEALMLFVMGAAGAYATTTLFPWEQLSVLSRGITDYIQFAWRFMMFPALFFSLAGAHAYLRFAQNREKMTIAVLILAVVMALPTISKQTRFNDVVHYGEITTPNIHYTEYNLPGTKVKVNLDREPVITGDLKVEAYEKDGTNITCQVEAREEGSVAFPIYGFDGYSVRADGKEIPYTLSSNNRLTVSLEKGLHDIQIRFAGKKLWRVMDLLSVVSLAATVLFVRKGKRNV